MDQTERQDAGEKRNGNGGNPAGPDAANTNGAQHEARHDDGRLVRLIRTVVEKPERGTHVDESVIKFEYFNSFNYSIIARDDGKDVNLTVGITSPNPGDGKTLVACNLAVSLALGTQRDTCLVDLNFSRPRIHDVFGLSNSPGLADAFYNGTIPVGRTSIEHLSVLSCGIMPLFHQIDSGQPAGGEQAGPGRPRPLLGLDQLTAFRDVIYSLREKFDFIIVDVPSLKTGEIPVLFTHYLNAMLVVINSARTKKEDVDSLFESVNPQQVSGFIMNRYAGHHG